MSSSFYNLFLGLLLQFNVVVKGFDILPDVLGYYLIFKGLKTLTEENDYFETANKAVLPLLVLSVVNLYNFEAQQIIPAGFIFAIDLVKIIVFALNIYLVYYLCKGAIEVAKSFRSGYASTTLQQRLYVFLGTAGAYLVLNIISKLPLTGAESIVQTIFTATYLIYFLYLFALLIVVAGIYRMYKELSPTPVQPVKAKAGGGKTSQTKRKR